MYLGPQWTIDENVRSKSFFSFGREKKPHVSENLPVPFLRYLCYLWHLRITNELHFTNEAVSLTCVFAGLGRAEEPSFQQHLVHCSVIFGLRILGSNDFPSLL